MNGERKRVLACVTEILLEITEEWDVGEITPASLLGSLVLESISLVYLVGELQRTYRLGDGLFSRLRSAGAQLKELSVDDLVDLVFEACSSRDELEVVFP